MSRIPLCLQFHTTASSACAYVQVWCDVPFKLRNGKMRMTLLKHTFYECDDQAAKEWEALDAAYQSAQQAVADRAVNGRGDVNTTYDQLCEHRNEAQKRLHNYGREHLSLEVRTRLRYHLPYELIDGQRLYTARSQEVGQAHASLVVNI